MDKWSLCVAAQTFTPLSASGRSQKTVDAVISEKYWDLRQAICSCLLAFLLPVMDFYDVPRVCQQSQGLSCSPFWQWRKLVDVQTTEYAARTTETPQSRAEMVIVRLPSTERLNM